MLTCSTERPWGVHPVLRSDQDCPRCGWTAPGPIGDSLADALADARTAVEEARARAAQLGWTVHSAGPDGALAA